MPDIQYKQIPIGVPTTVLQNETFSLPNRACWIVSSVALEFGQSQAGPWTASAVSATTGLQAPANWARCPSASALVTCKPTS
jgi:hypothetical protein